jgi:hypothetical protein
LKAEFSSTQGVKKGAVALFLILVVLTWPMLLHPFHLMGHEQGEASNHLWMFWRATQDGVVSNVPVGVGLPLMDPTNLPVFLAFSWIHPALGFNAVWFFNLLLAFVGAFSLARALGVGRAAAFSGGVACACSPFLSGLGSFGITESWAIGWLGIHIACLVRYVESRSKGQLAFSVLALALFLGSGWYSAVFAVVVEPLVLFVLVRRGGPLIPLVLQAAAAGALLLPRFLSFWSERALWSERWRSFGEVGSARVERWEAWREMPQSGADALNYVLPSVESVTVSKSVYLGLVMLSLAIVAGKRAKVLWFWSVPFLVLALGLTLSVAGFQQFAGIQFSLPAAWLTQLFPPLEGLTHWFRALAPATLFLAVAASMGVERLASKQARWLVLAPVLLLADSLMLSQTPWPRDQFSISPPMVYEAIRKDSGEAPEALLQIPLHNARREFTPDVPRIYNRWQPVHGLAVAENYESSDAILKSNRLVAWLQEICLGEKGQGGGLTLEAQKMWLKALRKQGFGHLVVHGVAERSPMDAWQCGRSGSTRNQRLQAWEKVNATLTKLVGAPGVLRGGDAYYYLESP